MCFGSGTRTGESSRETLERFGREVGHCFGSSDRSDGTCSTVNSPAVSLDRVRLPDLFAWYLVLIIMAVNSGTECMSATTVSPEYTTSYDTLTPFRRVGARQLV